ncbi:MAG TPA: cupin domain-containing protein [Thermomicrobiales bacterium]|nr:cupin domain-containing protein [Thermomicrobiales bacterium]
MKIVRNGEGESRPGSDTFTGPVDRTTLMPAQTPGGINLSRVHFDNGARTHWHEHPGEQILYVLDGEGRVGTASEEFTIHPGDIIYAAPGERHWHGAAPGESMTHLSITTVGMPTWFEAPEE